MRGEAYRKHVFSLKMVVIATGALLAVLGVVMVLLGIQSSDQSTFTIKVHDFDMALNVTHVGLIVIAFGVVLIVASIMTKYRYKETIDLNGLPASLDSQNAPSASGNAGGGGIKIEAELGQVKKP